MCQGKPVLSSSESCTGRNNDEDEAQPSPTVRAGTRTSMAIHGSSKSCKYYSMAMLAVVADVFFLHDLEEQKRTKYKINS